MIDNEMQVIGNFLNNIGLEFTDILTVDDFIIAKKTFHEIKRCVNAKEKINPIAIAKNSEFNIGDLLGCMNSALPDVLESNIDIVKKDSAKRKFDIIMREPQNGDVTEDIDNLITKLQEIQIHKKQGSIEIKDLIFKYMDELDKRSKNKGKEMYIGLPKLDKVLAGFHKQELTIIGARPSVGKSVFGLQIAEQVSNRGFKTLFVTLEMADIQLMERMVVKYSGVESEKLRLGNLEREDWEKISIGNDKIAMRNFTITSDIRTIQELRTKIITDRPDVVIIDYLGLMKDNSQVWKGQRWQEIASIARKLKLMTLDFNIPIIALAQLSRDAQNKIPTLADLRDSGELEQSADNVILLHAMESKEASNETYTSGFNKGMYVYGTESQCDEMIDKGVIPTLMIIEKQRNGATLTIFTALYSNKLSFEEVSKG